MCILVAIYVIPGKRDIVIMAFASGFIFDNLTNLQCNTHTAKKEVEISTSLVEKSHFIPFPPWWIRVCLSFTPI